MKFGLSAASIGLSLLMTQLTQAAEINAFITGAARRAYETLAPQFEATSGHKLVTQFALPPALMKKVDAGEPFDVLVLSYDVEDLIRRGTLVAGSRTVLGRVGVGVAVRTGAPKPDFSTVEAFKRALLGAKTFATSGEGSSGRYIAGLLERLGIAEQVKSKIRSAAPVRRRKCCRAARSTSWCRDCRRCSARPTSSGSAICPRKFRAGWCSAAASAPTPRSRRPAARCSNS